MSHAEASAAWRVHQGVLPTRPPPTSLDGDYVLAGLLWSAAYANELNRLSAAAQPEWRLRVAVADDVPDILAKIRGLAEFEREPEAVHVTEATLLEDGFGSRRLFCVLLVERASGGPPVGMAICHAAYSTWDGRVIFVEDVYVDDDCRGRGLGTLLFQAVARACLVGGAARMQWTALRWNTPATSLYAGPRIQAAELDEWVLFRLTREALKPAGGGAAKSSADIERLADVGPLPLGPSRIRNTESI